MGQVAQALLSQPAIPSGRYDPGVADIPPESARRPRPISGYGSDRLTPSGSVRRITEDSRAARRTGCCHLHGGAAALPQNGYVGRLIQTVKEEVDLSEYRDYTNACW